MERQSFSPRQADVLICAGRLPFKLAPVIRRIWDQMPQPKWAISMGACASTGEQFAAFTQGRHRIMIAAQQQQAHPRRMQAHHQLAVKLAGVTGRCAGIENIAGDQHGIHRVFIHLCQQPVDQRLMLGLPALAHEMLAEMPVGGVKDAHREEG